MLSPALPLPLPLPLTRPLLLPHTRPLPQALTLLLPLTLTLTTHTKPGARRLGGSQPGHRAVLASCTRQCLYGYLEHRPRRPS